MGFPPSSGGISFPLLVGAPVLDSGGPGRVWEAAAWSHHHPFTREGHIGGPDFLPPTALALCSPTKPKVGILKV